MADTSILNEILDQISDHSSSQLAQMALAARRIILQSKDVAYAETMSLDGKTVTLFPDDLDFRDTEFDTTIPLATAVWEDELATSSLSILIGSIEFSSIGVTDSADKTELALKRSDFEQELTSFRSSIGLGF